MPHDPQINPISDIDPKDRRTGRRSRLARFLSQISEKSAEQLNPRQIRTARRIAKKRGVTSQNDADILDRLKTLVETTQPDGRSDVGARALRNSSQRTESASLSDMSTLSEIEAGIRHRRGRRLRSLLWRLAALVLLPATLLSAYFLFWATPHYATYTEMIVQRDDTSSGGPVGLLGAFQTPMSTEAAAVQGYLTSRDAMRELIANNAYRAAISNPDIDFFQRLSASAGNERAFAKYKKQVRIGFDPTDNVIKMEVIAANPEHSLAFSNALIALAEAKVDHMSQRLRSDRLRGAHDSYELAETQLSKAQAKVLSLQHRRGVLSTELEASAQMNQISALQTSLQNNQLELAQLRDNLRPNPARETLLVKSIERHQTMIEDLRGSLASEVSGKTSLARIDAELKAAQSDLLLRQTMLAQTMNLKETARIEANRQSIYLATSVAPVLSDAPAYPKTFTNVLLSFLGFGALYLLLSLTGSILRDQINSA